MDFASQKPANKTKRLRLLNELELQGIAAAREEVAAAGEMLPLIEMLEQTLGKSKKWDDDEDSDADPIVSRAPVQASEVEVSDTEVRQRLIEANLTASPSPEQSPVETKASETDTKLEQSSAEPAPSAITDPTASPAPEQASDEVKVSDTETKQEGSSTELPPSVTADSTASPAPEQASSEANASDGGTKKERPSGETEASVTADPIPSNIIYTGKKDFKDEEKYANNPETPKSKGQKKKASKKAGKEQLGKEPAK